MSRKIMVKISDLRRVLREALLAEAKAEDEDQVKAELEATPEEEGEDSLDAQVDKYISDYESEAKSAKVEGRDWRATMKRFLREADDDEASDQATSAPDDSVDVDSSKQSVDDIDVDSFVNSVVRLIENYDNLLEVRNTILRRAANFLGKNYDRSVVDSFKEKLEDVHGIEIGKSRKDVEDDFEAPKAGEAGPFGSGGGGGGAPV
jgi:hypothetical protein